MEVKAGIQRIRGKLLLAIQRGCFVQDILSINAHLKYVEFLLHVFDTGSEQLTLGQIKEQFQDKFGTQHALLNQNFGIYRLLPLILMKETYKNQKRELDGDIAKIKIIRDAVAHHRFSINEDGYIFENNKDEVSLSYTEFTEFIHKIENEFYNS